MGDGYPSDWDSRRKEVYSRDNYECQNCGAKGGSKGNAELHAHHIVPVSKGGVHELSNLKTMCKGCHDAIHGDADAPSKKSRNNSTNSSISSISDRITRDEGIANGNVPFTDDAYRYAADRYPENNSSSQVASANNTSTTEVTRPREMDSSTRQKKSSSQNKSVGITEFLTLGHIEILFITTYLVVSGYAIFSYNTIPMITIFLISTILLISYLK